jgi:hypothetical protein
MFDRKPAVALEREANAAARQVMRGGTASVRGALRTVDGGVGRSAWDGSGQALAPESRRFFEQGFGRDFGKVRIHADSEAAQSASANGARAFTQGTHIVFGAGAYAPDTPRGQRLLAHELAHTIQQETASAETIQRQTPEEEAAEALTADVEEDVWGLKITRRMCRCKSDVIDDMDTAKLFADAYNTCDTAANPTAFEVEDCFDAAFPSKTTVASTSSSGTKTLPPPSTDPCKQIVNKVAYVHETMHARHTDKLAKRQGKAFFADWRKLAGDKDRVDKLRPTYPVEIAAFESDWYDGHDWAQDEVHAYTWHRRFLHDVLRVLNRIC